MEKAPGPLQFLVAFALLVALAAGYWWLIRPPENDAGLLLLLGAFVLLILAVVFHSIELPGLSAKREIREMKSTMEQGFSELRQSIMQVSSQVVSNTFHFGKMVGEAEPPTRSQSAQETAARAPEAATEKRQEADFESEALETLLGLSQMAGAEFLFQPRLGDARSKTAMVADALATLDDEAFLVEVKAGKSAGRRGYRQLMHILPLINLFPASYGIFVSRVRGIVVVPADQDPEPYHFSEVFVLKYLEGSFQNLTEFDAWIKQR